MRHVLVNGSDRSGNAGRWGNVEYAGVVLTTITLMGLCLLTWLQRVRVILLKIDFNLIFLILFGSHCLLALKGVTPLGTIKVMTNPLRMRLFTLEHACLGSILTTNINCVLKPSSILCVFVTCFSL